MTNIYQKTTIEADGECCGLECEYLSFESEKHFLSCDYWEENLEGSNIMPKRCQACFNAVKASKLIDLKLELADIWLSRDSLNEDIVKSLDIVSKMVVIQKKIKELGK